MNFKKGGFVLGLIICVLIVGIAHATIQAFVPTSPGNNTWTNDNTTDFTFTAVSDINSTFSCELFVNNVGYGVNASTANNTATTITANASLTNGQKTWNINCTDDNGTVSSAPYIVTVDATNPTSTISSPSNNSYTADNTPQIVFVLTDNLDTVLNYTFYVDGSSNVTGTANTGTATYVNLTTLSQAQHTVIVEAQDEATNKVNSTTLTITIDSISPNATFGTNPVNNYNSTAAAVTFEAVCTDNNPNTMQIWGNWTGTWHANQTNSSPANATTWSAPVTLSDGTYKWGVYCNDSSGNSDWSDTNRTFTVNANAPTITAISTSGTSSTTSSGTATVTATTDEASTCWYKTANFSAANTTGATVTSGNDTVSHSFSVSYSSNTNLGPYYISCRDTFNLNMSSSNSTGSISVTVTSDSGGTTTSTSGSGGTASRSVSGQFAQKSWGYLPAGDTAELDIENSELGLTQIQFQAREKMYTSVMNVYKRDELHSSITQEPTQNVYRYIEIKEWNIEEENIENAQISFKVSKTWLTENSVAKENIALFRYVNEEWVELSTTLGEDDGEYIHYTAETPGFSWFVIGQSETSLAAPATETSPESAETETGTETAGTSSEETEEPLSESGASWAAWLLLILVSAALVIYLVVQKKNKKKRWPL